MPIDKDTAHRILALMPGLWFMLGADGRYLEVSREDHPLLTRPWAGMAGLHLRDVLPRRAAEAVLSHLERCPDPGDNIQLPAGMPILPGNLGDVEATLLRIDAERIFVMVRDATERADTLRRLAETEARYQRAMEGTSDGLWEWNVATGEEILSERWKAMLGFWPGEGGEHPTSFFDCLHPDEVSSVRSALQAHFQLGAPYNLEVRLRTKSGGWRWFRTRGKVERDATGRPSLMAGAITDITVEHNIRKALLDSRSRFSAIFNSSPVGITITEMSTGRILEANPAAGAMLGYGGDEMVGRTTIDVGMWRDAMRGDTLERLLTGGPRATEEVHTRRRDGRPLSMRVSVERLNLSSRELLVAALVDITHDIEMRQALQEQREAYAAVVNGATDAIISVDADGRVRLFNPAAERIFGRSSASMLGGELTELLPSAHQAEHRLGLERFAAGPSGARSMSAGTTRGVRSDGSAIDLDATISRAIVAGQPVLTAIMRDITESLAAREREERYQQDLAEFARRLMVQEREASRRLALRLHDHLGQTLGTLRLNFDRLGVLSRSSGIEYREAQGEVRRLIDQAIVEVRQTLVDLRPSLLDDEGLAAALDNDLALRMRSHPGVDAWVDVPTQLQGLRWPMEVEYSAFMVAREAVYNALQHGSPRLVRVALDGDADHLCLDVHDDGIGMGTNAEKAPATGHMGLIGMRERSVSVGAELAISPSPDGGTCVHFEWRRATSP